MIYLICKILFLEKRKIIIKLILEFPGIQYSELLKRINEKKDEF